MTRRPVLWCCLIEFSITWWKTRECGRKGCLTASWPSSGAAQLIGLPRQLASSSVFRVTDIHSSLAVPLQCGWDHSAYPCPMVMRSFWSLFHVSSLKAPTPFCLSLCVVTRHISLPAGSPMLTGRAWAWATINISLLPFTCLMRLAASLCQSGFCFSSES